MRIYGLFNRNINGSCGEGAGQRRTLVCARRHKSGDSLYVARSTWLSKDALTLRRDLSLTKRAIARFVPPLRAHRFWRTKLPAVTSRGPLLLSDLDKLRLERHAPWFGITFRKEQGTASVLEWMDGTTVRQIALSAENVHLRLLAELCERILPWVMFSAGDSCADIYLGHGENRIRRLAELFSRSARPAR